MEQRYLKVFNYEIYGDFPTSVNTSGYVSFSSLRKKWMKQRVRSHTLKKFLIENFAFVQWFFQYQRQYFTQILALSHTG